MGAGMLLSPDAVHIFTDGSCHPKNRAGGWGAVLLFNSVTKELSGHKRATTNNEMELMAIYKALCALKPTQKPITVYSDSQYSINAVAIWYKGWARNGWRTQQGQPVKNKELIQEIVKIVPPQAVFQWVKGHVGIVHNERADFLAGHARKVGYFGAGT